MHRTDLARYQHDHSFGMEHRRRAESRTLLVASLTFVTMVVEIAAGIAFGSMALLADGIHMASHAVALGIGALVYVYARRLAGDPRLAFGSGKLNALGGYSSALLLGVFALVMVYESTARLIAPVPIRFDLAILVAFVGLAVNGVSIVLLRGAHDHHHDHDHDESDAPTHDHGEKAIAHTRDGDHNLRSAIYHVLADALTSVLALVALLAGKYYGAVWLDPAMGILGAGVVLWWAWGLIRASGGVLLDEQGPKRLRETIRERVEDIGDSRIADLHVWSVGPSLYAAELVVVSHDPPPAKAYRDRLNDLPLVHMVVETRQCQGAPC
ncbi:MAG: CDF family Co(II)/Ni(II) efflux transporter DmeF [Alphaproteobacteria bacterium]